ncbi:MAG: CinA family protein [Tannerellaceae bacterium]|nr:CinA family protein [Tannerellaceae bacterium]
MEHRLKQQEMPLEQQLGEVLKQKKWTMGTAESCTGGRIAGRMTALPGASAYYVGSVVSYSNEVKKHLLGVSQKDLDEQGAVSQPVIEQMVQGAMQLLGCDCAVATSGIAGPDGGTPEKPVGTVWIAAATRTQLLSNCYHFTGNREENMACAATTALRMLLKLLTEE